MIFLSYGFILFAVAFFGLYLLCRWRGMRLALIIVGGGAFQFFYGGLPSLVPVAILAVVAYMAGRSERPGVIRAAIAICGASLIFYKYTTFLISSVLEPLFPTAAALLTAASRSMLPATIPLGISFFTFEFVHYLTDVHRGGEPLLAAQLQAVQTTIGAIEKRIMAQHRSSEASQRLETIPGIGIVGASAIVATVADPNVFRSGRDFADWIGLVPRQDSTGGKQKLGPISKQGDRYLRRILVVGAHAVLRYAKKNPQKYPWLTQLLARKPFRVVAVALANKMARIAWALLAKGGTYRVLAPCGSVGSGLAIGG